MELLNNNILDPIRKLEIVTEMLPDHNPILKGSGEDNFLELEVGNGVAFSEGLKKCEKIAVSRIVISGGSVFAPHFHREKEIVIIYEGEILLWRGVKAGEDYESKQPEVYSTGDIIVIEPNVSHAARVVGKTRIIAVTIPASKHFPNGPRK